MTRDVINYLEELFRLDFTKVDIPELVNYLLTPIGDYNQGKKRLEQYFDAIDWDRRNQELKNTKPYSYWKRRG